MNLKATEQLLKKHFSVVEMERIDKEGVFKCVKSHNQKPYKILYIDCKEDWLKSDFKLEEYQEKYLLKDFYESSNYLQWNNYFIFLGEKEKIESHRTLKSNIENDDIYTRKYVMSVDDLEEWLSSTEKVVAKESDLIQQNLASIWTEELRKNKLDCVFLDTNYNNGVPRFLSGDPITEQTRKSEKKHSSSEQVISSIEELKLTKYRPYPKEEIFNFGRVNLISGVNGTGKTSLLEAVELFLCGTTSRNEKTDYSNFKIKAIANNRSDLFEFKPNNTRLYKDRDTHWYNVPYHRGSISTHIGFNKYNFFNSDAAFELYHDQDGNDLREAFEKIILGERVNYIEKRLDGFFDRFNYKRKDLRKKINDWNKELKEENRTIKELSELDDSPEKFYDEFIKECQDNNWHLNLDLEQKQLLSQFEKDHLVATQILNSIIVSLIWMDGLSTNSVKAELKTYDRISKQIKTINKQSQDISKTLKKNEKNIKELKEISEVLSKLTAYYETSYLDTLLSLQDDISNTKKDIEKLKKIEESKEKIQISYLSKREGSILEYENEIQAQLDRLNNEKEDITERVSATKEGLELLDQIVSEIKSKGEQFLKHKPDSNECPLCNTTFEENELEKKIRKAHEGFKRSEVLEDALEKQNEVLEKLKEENKELENLSKIKEVGFRLFGEGYDKRSISELIKALDKNDEELSKLTKELNHQILIQEEFEEERLSKEEFLKLRNSLDEFEITIADKNELDKHLIKNSKQIDTKKGEAKTNKTKLDALKDEKEKLLSEIEFESDEKEELLKKRHQNLQECDHRIAELKEYIEFKSKKEFSILKDLLERLEELFKKAKAKLKEKEETKIILENSDQKIQSLKEKIKSETQKLDQAQKAVDVIQKIKKNYSKNDFSKKFFEANKEEIVEAYKLIHNPREFENIEFEDGEIRLLRTSSKKYEPITKISSGQRSALALSIFLALNKKLNNGPNLMLFDDPVTMVDDMNTLSLLDYLREIAINNNRQIFFATANDDLAYLFRKKFEFMSDESFKEFQLVR